MFSILTMTGTGDNPDLIVVCLWDLNPVREKKKKLFSEVLSPVNPRASLFVKAHVNLDKK